MASRSKQESFAEKLKGPMGLALYHPILVRDGKCENVGDVGFFDKNDGSYKYLANAFCLDVGSCFLSN